MPALSSLMKSAAQTFDAHAWHGEIVKIWHDRLFRLFDSYHPERHYMRGPGPKCREKQWSMPARPARHE